MKSRSGEKIKMTSLDELLGVAGEESATDVDALLAVPKEQEQQRRHELE